MTTPQTFRTTVSLCTGAHTRDGLREALRATAIQSIRVDGARALIFLAVEEVVANVCEHGYAGAPGEPIDIEVSSLPGGCLSVVVEDRSPVCDVTRLLAGDGGAPPPRRGTRGWGLTLVREIAISVVHRERKGGGNALTLMFDPALVGSMLEGRVERAG